METQAQASEKTNTPETEAGSAVGKKSFRPVHGRELGEIDVREIEAKDKYETARTRDRIAYVFLTGMFLSLLIAAVHGLFEGSFATLKDVWAVVGPFAAGIATYYFYRGPKGSG